MGGFDGADTSDIVLRNMSNGQFEMADVNGNSITNVVGFGQVGLEWNVVGFGDFSSNANETDMLMRNGNTGAFEIYDISNNQITSAAGMGQVGLGVADRRLWRFLRQCQRNRHADAQQQYRRV